MCKGFDGASPATAPKPSSTATRPGSNSRAGVRSPSRICPTRNETGSMPDPLTLADLPHLLETDSTARRIWLQEKGRADFAWFCRQLLGFKDMNQEHDALCEFLQHHP